MIPVFPGSVASGMGVKRKYENRKGPFLFLVCIDDCFIGSCLHAYVLFRPE